MGTVNRKLPRVKNADRPRPGEVIRKSGGADLQNGWLGRHGTMYLGDERAVFVPTILDTILGAKRRELLLDDIEQIERLPRTPDGVIPGAKRPRVIITSGECAYEFMFGDIDAWIDAFQIVYRHRVKNGKPHVPEVLREGSTSELLMEL